MLYYSIFLILVLFVNVLIMTHFEKKTVRREIPQQKETLPSNYSIQRNTVTEQEENIFSHFTPLFLLI